MTSKKHFVMSVFISFFLLIFSEVTGTSLQKSSDNSLPVRFEELTASDFGLAVETASSTCIIPVGILEKHGPHLPLGTDLITCREISFRAARREYSIVFPEYYAGQIFEAKHQPGTIAYSTELMFKMLEETCAELARNGLKKIILVNGHGGNIHWLRLFCQIQLERHRDYVVYLFQPSDQALSAREKKLSAARKTSLDGHAGEIETSIMLALRPELVKLERASWQSGEDLSRLASLKNAYTGIWWYASHPDHYRGTGSAGLKELGELALKLEVDELVEMIKSVKSDKISPQLQKEFFERSQNPSLTGQRKK